MGAEDMPRSVVMLRCRLKAVVASKESTMKRVKSVYLVRGEGQGWG